MKQLRPGYNVRSGISTDWLISHSQIVLPSGMVFTNDLKEAWRFKKAVPTALVANRITSTPGTEDKLEANLLKIDPVKFLNDRLAEFDAQGIPHNQIVIHTTNEPAYAPDLIDWHLRLGNEVIKHPDVQVVMLNFGVGIVPLDDGPLSLMHNLLKLMVEHPDQLYFGNHGYGATVWTSGVNGTAPPGYNERFKPRLPAQEYAIKPEDWPKEVTGVCYHAGRWRAVAQYCHRHFRKLPTFWETELAPSDDINDVGWWQQSLPKNDSDSRINGMWTCAEAWKVMFPQWSKEEVIWYQTQAMIEVLYEAPVTFDGVTYPTPVRAVSLYNMGDLGGWEKFNYRKSVLWFQKYQALAEGNNNTPAPPKPNTKPLPQFEPKPVDAGAGRQVRVSFTASFRNLRSGPGERFRDEGDISSMSILTFYDKTIRKDTQTNKLYAWVETAVGDGWMWIDEVTIKNVAPEPTPEAKPYTYTLSLVIKAKTPDAADLLARYVAMQANRDLNQFLQYRELIEALPLIVDTQVSLAIPEEEKP